jgi:hypothetical protein
VSGGRQSKNKSQRVWVSELNRPDHQIPYTAVRNNRVYQLPGSFPVIGITESRKYQVPIGPYASRTFPFCIAFRHVRFTKNHDQTFAWLLPPLRALARFCPGIFSFKGVTKTSLSVLSLISYACRTLAPHRIAMSIQIGCIQFLSFSLKNQVYSQFQFIYYHILLRNKEKNCATFLFSRLSFTIPSNLKNDRFVLQFFILEQLDKMDLHA